MKRGPYAGEARRFEDGIYLNVQPDRNIPELVFVQITSADGFQLYTGSMFIHDALVEIPFQLDRARAMDAIHRRPHAKDCRCNGCIHAPMGLPSEPIKYADDDYIELR